MLPLGRRTILQHQLDSLRSAGVTKVSIVRGYLKDQISANQPVTFFDNPDYQQNNILKSLFCAEPAITGDVLICYSDIVFSPNIVKALMFANSDITLAIDRDWRKQYIGRTMHPLEEAEKVILDDVGRVAKIGKHLDDSQGGVDGEFIGMLRLTALASPLLKRHFRRCQQLYEGSSFQQADKFSNAYLTDLILEMIDCGEAVFSSVFYGGWMEIDTAEDLAKARAAYGD
jgi:choline kinase